MNCKNHVDKEAGFICCGCGEHLCMHCTVELNGKIYCKECLERHIQKKPVEPRMVRMRKKSRFLTFCFSVVPGAGHMYLGLINKGLILMSMFFSVVVGLSIFGEITYIHWLLPTIGIPLYIICVSYSVFDSLSAAYDINTGKTVIDSNEIEFAKVFAVIKDKIVCRKRIIGFFFILIGFIGIFNVCGRTVNSILAKYFDMYIPSFANIFFPVLLVVLGCYLIRKGQIKI